jgi:arylsulfatase
VGRWERGKAAESKYDGCAIRNNRWKLVSYDPKGLKSWQLFDLKTDPGEKDNVASAHPETVGELEAAYDAWWTSVQPQLVNENVPIPAENAFRTLYREQFGNP